MKPQHSLDPSAEGRLARAHFSAAFMSDSKWRKLLAAVRDADVGVDQMWVKFIDTKEAQQMRFPPSLSCPRPYIDTIEFGPVELRSIEWMEFETDLTRLLDPIGNFPVELRFGRTRIVGYRV